MNLCMSVQRCLLWALASTTFQPGVTSAGPTGRQDRDGASGQWIEDPLCMIL
jgi:hypothetical protein